ncbi:MAG TPA: ABC transporter permease [Chloroflexota bacterium]|nr:ABC transporter permease [Chloroflexota bacterium]
MTRYIQQRLLLMLPTILLTTLVVFLMLQLIPGDPASIYLGENQATPERLEQIREQLGLNRPLYVQYGDFVLKAVRGDLGRSVQTNRPVIQEITDRLPNTIILAVLSMALAMIFGITLGMLAGLNQNSWLDAILMLAALAGVSIPVFWLGLLLILLFAVQLGWLPATGQGGWNSLIMPAVTLAALSTATLARLVRASMIEVLNQDYLQTSRAKGLPQVTIVVRHALPNALIPIVTVIGLQFGNLLSGAVITETVFARSGLGKLVVDSIQNKDLPTVQGVILVLATIYVVVNFVVDLSYAVIDPRIRLQ